MGKTGKWLRNLLTGGGKKDKETTTSTKNPIGINQNLPTSPLSTPIPTTPKEKRRWSFRRSSATGPAGRHESNYVENMSETNDSYKMQALVAAVAEAKAATAMIQSASLNEEASATKIQSVFRAHLARKALNALRGLVKLQALVRGHLVRKQATATLRCMQALITVQARARAQRLLMVAEETKSIDQRHFNHRKSTQDFTFRNSNHHDGNEENIKIVEMDVGNYNKPIIKARNSYSNLTQLEKTEYRAIKQEQDRQISPSPSAITDISPRTCSNHFDEYYNTAQSSPQCYSVISKPDTPKLPISYPRSEYAESIYSEYQLYPSYMANTESSRAKLRSHSAPKQRPAETFERQPSKRRPSLEGRNVPRAVRMQRSSSHVGSTVQGYNYPWSVKLDKSSVSLMESECGSTSTVLTSNNYCRSYVGFDVQGARY